MNSVLQNIADLLRKLTPHAKTLLELIWKGIAAGFPIVLSIGGVLFGIGIVLGTIGAIFEALARFAKQTPAYANEAAHLADTYFPKFLVYTLEILKEYPVISVGVVLLLILYINNTTLKRVSQRSFGKTIIIFSIITYLLYRLSSAKEYALVELSEFLSTFMSMTYVFVYPDEARTFEIGFDRESIIIFIIFLFVYWINSRLLWLASIAALESALIYLYIDDINIFLAGIPTAYYRILQGLLPLILSVPFIFAIWVFRDNDKYKEISGKIRELDLKEKELELKRQDLEHNCQVPCDYRVSF